MLLDAPNLYKIILHDLSLICSFEIDVTSSICGHSMRGWTPSIESSTKSGIGGLYHESAVV